MLRRAVAAVPRQVRRCSTVALVDVECDVIERKILGGAGLSVLWTDSPKPRAVADIPAESRDSIRGLMVRRCQVRESDLALLPNLRVVLRMGVGVDNIDLAACTRAGVIACNQPDAWVEEVADSAWGLILSLLRGTVPLCNHTRFQTGWTAKAPLSRLRRLRGMRLGIVGLGRIGAAAAARASGFGVAVSFYDPKLPPGHAKGLGYARCSSFQELLETSDIISFHCPLTPDTAHMLGPRALSQLPPGAGKHVVNTARGGVLDEEACAEAMRDGRIAGLALDVLEREPTNMSGEEAFEGSAVVAARKDGLNVLISPHASFYSAEAFEEMRYAASAEVARVLTGSAPWYQVNAA
eukprot:TRINITY_DN14000_c0_g1_i1.p1 TRINITY_DN14000_c0_g1~~TRINITY_DN14000_c0_g1_i1.p1  ORF type:complete len:352 (+),score=106.55 TRINITY_DN14000_c0_g1_i1:46-1101(+)